MRSLPNPPAKAKNDYTFFLSQTVVVLSLISTSQNTLQNTLQNTGCGHACKHHNSKFGAAFSSDSRRFEHCKYTRVQSSYKRQDSAIVTRSLSMVTPARTTGGFRLHRRGGCRRAVAAADHAVHRQARTQSAVALL